MVTYDTRRARPPYIIGMSLQQVCKKFGVSAKEPELTVKESTPKEIKNTVVETPVIEETIFVEPVIEKPVAENLVLEEKVEEPVVEETVEVAVEEPTEEVVEEVSATPLDVLEISAKNIKLLQTNNINTVEELLALDIDLEDLPKIGRAAKQAIMEGLTKWQNAQSPMTSTNEN